MAVYRNGVQLASAEQKARVMELTGWSAKEYQKEYLRLYKQVTNTNHLLEASGAPKIETGVADLLYREQNAKAYAEAHGRIFEPTYTLQLIRSAPTTSKVENVKGFVSRNGGGRAVRDDSAAISAVLGQFGGFVEKSKYKDAIARDLEALREAGQLTAQNVYAVVRGYADKLDDERRCVVAHNKGIDDRSKKLFFSSR